MTITHDALDLTVLDPLALPTAPVPVVDPGEGQAAMLPPSDPVKDYLFAPLAQYKILFTILLPSLTRHIISVIFCL